MVRNSGPDEIIGWPSEMSTVPLLSHQLFRCLGRARRFLTHVSRDDGRTGRACHAAMALRTPPMHDDPKECGSRCGVPPCTAHTPVKSQTPSPPVRVGTPLFQWLGHVSSLLSLPLPQRLRFTNSQCNHAAGGEKIKFSRKAPSREQISSRPRLTVPALGECALFVISSSWTTVRGMNSGREPTPLPAAECNAHARTRE
jgi:hypothetical protein